MRIAETNWGRQKTWKTCRNPAWVEAADVERDEERRRSVQVAPLHEVGNLS
jgi:hypothetical protein